MESLIGKGRLSVPVGGTWRSSVDQVKKIFGMQVWVWAALGMKASPVGRKYGDCEILLIF
ncbi:MAG: hypothetical protein ACTSUE_07340 [Promethearchaeota archaeon]